MTSKERIKLCVEMKPVDRLPFWPKLNESNQRRWGKPVGALHDYIGSDRAAGISPSYKEIRKNTRYEEHNEGHERRSSFITPAGTLTMTQHFNPDSCAWHPTEYPIKTKQDMEIMTCWYKDAEPVYDKERAETAKKRYENMGGGAFVFDSQGTSALMYFIEWLAGTEQGHYLLADYPGETEALFDEIHKTILKRFEVSAEHSPADMLFLSENTSTRLISPGQYKKYCFPHLKAYGEIAEKSGRTVMLHMCGHLKQLLPELNKLPASIAAFEAFTPPTVGDTTLYEGRINCPERCLLGGTSAVVWMWTAKEIIAYLEESLAVLPHHRGIVLSSAGVMPPACSPETIKEVKDWLNGYIIRN